MTYYQHPKYKRVYGDNILTPIGRLVWPALVTPKDPPPPEEGQEPGRPRFEINWLSLGADPKELADFLTRLQSMCDAMVAQYNKTVKVQIGSLGDLLNDGNKLDREKYPYFKDQLFLVARNSYPMRKPGETKGWQVKNRKKEVIDPASVKGGMLGRLLVTPHIGPTGVSYRIEVVQVTGDDGTRYGGAARDHDAMLDALDDDGSEPVGTPLAQQEEAPVQSAAPEKEPTAEEAANEALGDLPPDPLAPESNAGLAQPAPVEAPKVHGAAAAKAATVGTLSPKQLQAQIKENAAKAVALQNAGAVTNGSAPKTGRGKGAAIDNL